MLLYRRGQKKRETLVKVPIYDLGLGHSTRPDPNRLRPGHSVRTFDINLDRPNSIVQRKGIRYLCENPVGAAKITDFEEAVGGAPGQWSGAPSDDSATDADGTKHWRPYKPASLGTKSKKLTAAAAVTVQSFLDLSTAPLNLGNDLDEYIVLWFYLDDKSFVNWTSGLRITLETVANVDVFTLYANPATVTDRVADGKPVNFLAARKRDLIIGGAPLWTNIIRVGIKWTCTGGPGTFVSFMDAYLAPKQVDGLYEFRQSSRRGGGHFKLGAARGTVSYLDEQLHRWVPLITGRQPYRPVTIQSFGDFAYVSNPGGDKVKLIAGDGKGALTPATCYDAGIEAPAGALGFLVGAIGALPVGVHEYRIRYYSEITGLPGNSTAYLSPATVANGSVHIEPLPVSADPKATHKDIYRRDATEGYFRRVARVANGLQAYDDVIGTLDLGEVLEGRPTYVNSSPPPRLGFQARVGNRMTGAGVSDDLAVAYFSRPNNGEQWDLFAAPVRLSSGRYDEITAIFEAFGYCCVSLGDPLHVGTQEAGPSGFRFQQRAEMGGPTSHKSVVVTPDGARWRGRDGYYFCNRNFRPLKISRDWDIAPAAPGVIEPAFTQLDSRHVQEVQGAYLKDRAQILWTDKMNNDETRNLVAVYHVGHVESYMARQAQRSAGGSISGWAFHRYAKGHVFAGATALAEYIDDADGTRRLMGGGPGGAVFEVDSEEIDDVMADKRVLVNGHAIMPFMGNPGVAIGQHQLKDFVYHDITFVPIANTPVILRYYFDWKYLSISDSETPVGDDSWSVAALPFQAGPIYAQVGTYHRIDLPAGRHRNVAWEIENQTLGGAFHVSENVWWMEYMGGEGAF
jgi:hypothetical protein